jgi:hypothetical protein
MKQTEREDVDRERLEVVLGPVPPRYLTVIEAARASGFSRQAVTAPSGVATCEQASCARAFASTPDDFLAWMDGDRAATTPSSPCTPRRVEGPVGARKKPAPDGLRSLLMRRNSAA